MTAADKAKIECRFFKAGACRHGRACEFKHSGSATAGSALLAGAEKPRRRSKSQRKREREKAKKEEETKAAKQAEQKAARDAKKKAAAKAKAKAAAATKP